MEPWNEMSHEMNLNCATSSQPLFKTTPLESSPRNRCACVNVVQDSAIQHLHKLTTPTMGAWPHMLNEVPHRLAAVQRELQTLAISAHYNKHDLVTT